MKIDTDKLDPEAVDLAHKNFRLLVGGSAYFTDFVDSILRGMDFSLEDEHIIWFIDRRKTDLKIARSEGLDSKTIDELEAEILKLEEDFNIN